MFTEVNPDKGTETILSGNNCNNASSEFTEVNPDKGTETVFLAKNFKTFLESLQKLTPIRGRKPTLQCSQLQQVG